VVIITAVICCLLEFIVVYNGVGEAGMRHRHPAGLGLCVGTLLANRSLNVVEMNVVLSDRTIFYFVPFKASAASASSGTVVEIAVAGAGAGLIFCQMMMCSTR
jgi:hypothetical protein